MHLHLDRWAAEIAGLPWHLPLVDWPEDILVGLPRGISRHVVRFVRPAGTVVAVKETTDALAHEEYETLSSLTNLAAPTVEPLGYVTGRRGADGSPLPGALLTPHLQYSLPYRALFSRHLARDTALRLVDALAVLLVRLHLAGFYWGDVSLSNALFRRDADSFAAYLVDAETGELHYELSDGQRDHDLELARVNIAGDFLDLQAGGLVDDSVDPLAVSDRLKSRYTALWTEITRAEEFDIDERWRIDDKIRRLNDLGFDLGEFSLTTDLDGITLRVAPKVVEPGHHSRRLRRLTGIRAEENQARRLLNDIDAFHVQRPALAETEAADRWQATVYRPVLDEIPPELAGRLEAPQIFHEFLDHRWFLAEEAGADVSQRQAVRSYVDTVLSHRRAEREAFVPPPG
ncbi:DUF4032 domain-containing protein [Brevibacterium litoralis]|uniref:DUF4032 domain-containing protein n=1 Tax=Brevibacterium litoralis TaxID=3138935 RepID=UPI0032EBFC3B